MFAKPDFRLWIPYCGGSSQTGFCLCTLRRVSDPPEPIFGPPRYFFKGVPPQPNCPPTVVPTPESTGKRHGFERSVFHCCLPQPPEGLRSIAPDYALQTKPHPSDRLQ